MTNKEKFLEAFISVRKDFLDDSNLAGVQRATKINLPEDRIIRASGLVERLCEHGIGHPDKSVTNKVSKWEDWMEIHGCDGCCGDW